MSKIETADRSSLIDPHGGYLVSLQLCRSQASDKLVFAKKLKPILLSAVNAADVEMLGIGAYSPLTGFIDSADYESIVAEMRLADGIFWPLPITLPITDTQADHISLGEQVALVFDSQILAILTVSEKFRYDKQREAELVFGTTDSRHPGVARLFQQPDIYLAGEIQLLQKPFYDKATQGRRTPHETRQAFAKLGWQQVVGFQTRNPIHAGHEYVFKHALELVDGLLLHPLVGRTKNDDVKMDVRVRSYQAVLDYYPEDRVLLDYFPTAMRYAGPREAVFHAICRQNYGCSHFVVGRDHAGVGDFYAPDAAIKIFDQFSPAELGIKILTYAPTYYCPKCLSVVTSKTCSHTALRFSTSGSHIRKIVERGEKPAPELMRPEVSKILLEAAGYEWSDSNLSGEQIAELLKSVDPDSDKKISTGKSTLLNNSWKGTAVGNGNGRYFHTP